MGVEGSGVVSGGIVVPGAVVSDHSFFFLSGAGEILSLEISKIFLSAEVSGENFQIVHKQSINHYFCVQELVFYT